MDNEAPRLLKALALSQRFHLYIAQCASPRAADQLIHAIETQLPKLRGAPVQVVRLDPYAEQATDAPLTSELIGQVLVPLLAAPAERRGHGTIHVVDASRATASDDEAWARLFASWNEKRNLLQQLSGEVVVVVPRALSLVFATEAPDVWSIRSGEYEIAEQLAAPDVIHFVDPGVPESSIHLGDHIKGGPDDIDDVEEAVRASKETEAAAPSFDLIDVRGDHPVPSVALPAPGVTREPDAAPRPGLVSGAGSADDHRPPRITQVLGMEEIVAGAAVARGAGGRIAGPAAPASPPVVEATRRPTFAVPSPWRLIPPLSLFG
ncbi:MAG TPA: hypothetical protein VHN14_22890, partial [Kofleriaceae bacterium]|nr:hypothetical protein [Kofleriaceae bacterium]